MVDDDIAVVSGKMYEVNTSGWSASLTPHVVSCLSREWSDETLKKYSTHVIFKEWSNRGIFLCMSQYFPDWPNLTLLHELLAFMI